MHIAVLSQGILSRIVVLPQHEQFYPEGLSYWVLENLGWIKLAPKFKDFPAPTAIFKDFQGLELFISNFKDFHGLSRCMRTLLIASVTDKT